MTFNYMKITRRQAFGIFVGAIAAAAAPRTIEIDALPEHAGKLVYRPILSYSIQELSAMRPWEICWVKRLQDREFCLPPHSEWNRNCDKAMAEYIYSLPLVQGAEDYFRTNADNLPDEFHSWANVYYDDIFQPVTR